MWSTVRLVGGRSEVEGERSDQHGPGGHAYPRDLAALVRASLHDASVSERRRTGTSASGGPVPDLNVLEHLLSTCYQASLLREEARPVTFRLVLGEPELFAAAEGPPAGLHRLMFTKFRPFDEHELRRLAPAAGFHRSLIAARLDQDGVIQLWGLVHSGPRWLQSVRGGRHTDQFIPPVPMVAVTGPGRVLVSRGTRTLAALAGGSLTGAAMDVFSAPWLSAAFSEAQHAQWVAHATARERSPMPWGALDPSVGSVLAQHVVRRIVATIRESRHGGTLIFLPDRCAREVLAGSEYLNLKYKFSDEEPRRRIMSVTVQIMNELARLHAAVGPAGWAEYEASRAPQLAVLDEALFEVAHLIAALADVDGAVVMTTRLELLGFGGEISGALPEVVTVNRALDIEGAQRALELTERVGTRHRWSYRLSQHLRDAVLIVVSHDGGVRFVRWHDHSVMCWDQIATGPWEV